LLGVRETTVVIPASVISDTPHLREKTGKLGSIARSCSIFGVDQIVIYVDDDTHDQSQNLRTCDEILRFIETPQYLRKRLFKMSPILQFAGILPPLQISSHNVAKSVRDCKASDWREGVVIARNDNELIVDVGLELPVECDGKLPVGTRVTIEVVSVGDTAIRGKLVDRAKISLPLYWGYRVRAEKTGLGVVLERGKADLKIGTSRNGQRLKDVWSKISELLNEDVSVMIVFGSPKLSLQEILRKERIAPGDAFDFLVNSVPGQGTLTVRTEEAVAITLASLNILRSV
jgi:hypothetical protein